MNDTTSAGAAAPSDSPQAPARRHWWQSLGPGLVTACVVIGPGSILTSSQVGAKDGFSKIWVVVIAVIFMLAYVKMAAKLGAVAGRSSLDLVAERAGRPLAVLIGLGVFFISAAYQFGNNLGVHTALNEFFPFRYWIVAFNALAIVFLFGFHNLYSALEKTMSVFVAVMLISFAINLGFARPDVGEMAQGLVPRDLRAELGLPLMGLIATTFVISAAFYQSYLVRFKGWTVKDLPAGLTDARVSALIMCVITLMIMSTAAAVLRGKSLESAADVANQLQPLFGEFGKIIFCLGLFAAAFSSFIVNSMIGGFILADSLKLGSMPRDLVPRLLTAGVLLSGMGVALYVISTGVRPVGAIVAAQAATVLAAPLMAAILLWLTNLKSIMGEHKNGPITNVIGGLGFLTLLGINVHLIVNKIWPGLQAWLS